MERKQWETEFLPIEVQVTNHHEEEGETEHPPIGESKPRERTRGRDRISLSREPQRRDPST
jgi:hypothetical protein